MGEMRTGSLSKQASKRIEWLDALKGFAIIAVVLGHTLLGYTENDAFGEYNDFFCALKDWIYIWHMPLFLCLSGYSFCLAYYRKDALDANSRLKTSKVKRQIINLVLLYVMFSIVFYALKIPLAAFTDNKLTISDAAVNLLIPNTLMWYLWVLAIYYMILLYCKPVMPVIASRPKITLGILLIIAVVQRLSGTFINWRLCFGNFFHCAFYFCFGMVLCLNKDCYEAKKQKSGWMWIGMLIVIVHFVCYMALSAEMADREAIDFVSLISTVLNEFVAVLIIILAFAAANRHQHVGNLLPALGRASLVIYLLHTYIVTAMKVVAIRMGLCSSMVMDIVVMAMSVIIPIGICYFVDWIRRKNRLIGAIFAPGKHIKIFD